MPTRGSGGFGFRTKFAVTEKPSDPESLFKDLKVRDPEVRYLWAHQADVLRAYDKEHQDASDVALELPTGTGKTLIGLLIAEYRRRKFDERALYLCPTRQLAQQVGEHAKLYGIQARVLLRPDYEGLNDFHLGRAVGVTTYSGLFNTNPRIQDPQCIVLDDAHAGEDYISGLWSVSVSRHRDEDLYRRLLQLIEPEMEDSFVARMLDDDLSADSALAVDMLPHPKYFKLSGEIRELLDERIGESGRQRFSWSMIRDHLHACCLFLSWRELLLRPVIPPTMTHLPFASANQRIYMSATLGEGGELERITGIPRIRRIPAPEGWDRQGSGRRLFLFPNMAMEDRDIEEVAVEATKESGRALVLTPTVAGASVAADRFSSRGMMVLTSSDVECSLNSFVDREDAALVLANRYDGVDLPDDECRLLVFEGLPAGTNLQDHRVPGCLLKAWDRGRGPGLEPEDLSAWFDWEEESLRYGVDPEIGREDLAALIESSTVEIAGDEHRADHSAAGDFARWGRLGGLETLRRYGRPWFALLARRRWKKVGAEALDCYQAEQFVAKAGTA